MRHRRSAEHDYAAVGTLGRLGGIDSFAAATPEGHRARILPIVPPDRLGHVVRELGFSFGASAILHIMVAVVLVLWQDRPPPPPGSSVIQVEFVPANAPSAGDSSRHGTAPPTQEPAFVPPTEEGAYASPLRLDPSLRLDPLLKTTLDKAPPADSGNLSHGDPLQNYGVVIAQMVSRHVRYPAAARAHREKAPVKVSLTLARDGSLLDVQADTPGREDFATSAIEAAHAAAPYPRFPAALDRSTAIINFAIFIEDPDTK
jgi:TonB family protein